MILDQTTTRENQHSSCQSFSWPSSRNENDNTIVFRALLLDKTLPGTNSSHTTIRCHGESAEQARFAKASRKADDNLGDASTMCATSLLGSKNCHSESSSGRCNFIGCDRKSCRVIESVALRNVWRLTLRSGFSRGRAGILATAETLAPRCTNSRICDASVLRRFALPSPPASSIVRRQYENHGRGRNLRVLAVSQSICQTSGREQAAGNVRKKSGCPLSKAWSHI